jgi:prefoldin subunit 5
MNTNTSGAALIGDGTNFNPVAISGDITIAANGTAAIGSGVIVNADINASAAIADSKLATISTAGKVDIGALEIDGATDIGAALADADLFIVDDGANGTERKMEASRLQTYIEGKISGDITISSGTAAIGSGVIVNADINSSAAIADSKLATISTAGKVDIGALEIDGATDIGADLVDADLIIVDDGANGTERKAAMSRVATYVEGGISGDITISSGTAAIGSGVVVNADVSASAAIAFSKMENLTASRALVSDANGDVSVSAVTSTEIGHLDGVTSSIQTQLNSAATVGKAIAMAIVFG